MDVACATLPDLVLLDIGLPLTDGWEVFQDLRQCGCMGNTPILAVSAHALEDEKRRARELGFDAYLTKPIEPGQLAEAVARHLESRR